MLVCAKKLCKFYRGFTKCEGKPHYRTNPFYLANSQHIVFFYKCWFVPKSYANFLGGLPNVKVKLWHYMVKFYSTTWTTFLLCHFSVCPTPCFPYFSPIYPQFCPICNSSLSDRPVTVQDTRLMTPISKQTRNSLLLSCKLFPISPATLVNFKSYLDCIIINLIYR